MFTEEELAKHKEYYLDAERYRATQFTPRVRHFICQMPRVSEQMRFVIKHIKEQCKNYKAYVGVKG